MRRLFLQLSDSDPKSRDQAKTDLMGYGAQDLPKLRQIVADNVPLSPGVISDLREIVTQIFLAGDKYQDLNGTDCDASSTDSPAYFLGIRWPNGSDTNVRLGAEIDDRLPGFPGYRFLRKGDMILGVGFDPDQPVIETKTVLDLVAKIKTPPLRQKLILQILRAGEVITRPVTMSPRPINAGPATPPLNAQPFNYDISMQQFGLVREQHANEYWHLNYDSLIDGLSNTTASNPLE